jgi:hypothetical protein
VRVSALDEVGDRDAPVGSKPWALWVVGQAKLQRDELERDASALRRLIGKMQKHEAWKALGVPSFDMLCTTQLRLSADEVSAVLKARKGQSLGVVLGRHGGKRQKSQGDNVTLTRGNSPKFLAARLRRDHPDAHFDESVRGSVRQAAIAAGIVKVPSVLDKLRKLWAKASDEDRVLFVLDSDVQELTRRIERGEFRKEFTDG